MRERFKFLSMVADFILSNPDIEAPYVSKVSLLLKAFSISVLHGKFMAIIDEVEFFQPVRPGIVKITHDGEGRTKEDIEILDEKFLNEL